MNRDIRLSTEFWDHPKTVKLERRLGLQGPKSLQILWAWAAKYHPDGRLEGEDVEAIEIAAKWPGNDSSTIVNESLTPLERSSTFVGTLLALRWIDQDEDGTFSLHDWHEHNAWAANVDERSDKARLSRMGKTHPAIYKGLVKQGKKGVTKEEYESLTTVKRKVNVPLTPAPAPAPAPSPAPSPNEGNTIALPTRSEREFDSFWQAYPRKKSKGHAQKTWEKLRKAKQLPELAVILDAIAAAKAGQDWQRDGGKFIPHPGTWLNSSGWEDVQEIESTAPDKFAGAI